MATRGGKESNLERDPVAHVGPLHDAASDDVSVELGNHEPDVRPLHLVAVELGRPAGLVRQELPADADEVLDVRVSRSWPDLDHPDLLSLPCRFAYRSPRRKTSSPSGTETIPMMISGQMSDHIALMPAPLMIASRIPSSAYVAGEIFDSACIHSGSTLTG